MSAKDFLIASEIEFTEREINEIEFAESYITNFNHGTAGHLAYTVIDKLMSLVQLQERKIEDMSNA